LALAHRLAWYLRVMMHARRATPLALVLAILLTAFVLIACGEETDGEICRDADSAVACETCCDEAGYRDWSYNAQYTPACACVF
jgi:hypothetical protein